MPYLWNAWYVAGLAGEINSSRPLARMLLGEAVVLYRDLSGQAVALSDRCPHRFAPLHRGRIHQGVLECPYHGLRFDGSGQCVHNPHGDGRIPPTAQVRSFPLQERYGMVWIWMGEPLQAAQTEVQPFEYLNPEHNVTASGYLRTQAHYQLSADNLLDLSHFQFLHPATLGSEQMSAGTCNFFAKGDTVWSRRDMHQEKLQDFVADAFGVPRGTRADRRLDVQWNAPGLLTIEVTVTPSGMPPAFGRMSLSGHFLTPETERSTHYFFAFGLPKAMGEAAPTLVEYAVQGLMEPFKNEDLPMLEAQQKALGDGDFWSAQPVSLTLDGAALRSRRIMERKIAEERRAGAMRPTTTVIDSTAIMH
jgi:phenylpropionate dioxygenase-like ring-hydroxylating dioxygenase large terminal subunit